MTPRKRLVLLVCGGLAAGGASGAGVGLSLYPPAVAVGLAVAIGLAVGWFVRRTIRDMRRRPAPPG